MGKHRENHITRQNSNRNRKQGLHSLPFHLFTHIIFSNKNKIKNEPAIRTMNEHRGILDSNGLGHFQRSSVQTTMAGSSTTSPSNSNAWAFSSPTTPIPILEIPITRIPILGIPITRIPISGIPIKKAVNGGCHE